MRRLFALVVLGTLALLANTIAATAESGDLGSEDWVVWDVSGGPPGGLAVSDDLVVVHLWDPVVGLKIGVPSNPSDPRHAFIAPSGYGYGHLGASSVAAGGDRIAAAGTPNRVHILDWNGSRWLESFIDAPRIGIEAFGSGLDVDGSTVVVGARGEWEECCQVAPGAVFVFEHQEGGAWLVEELPRPEVNGAHDALGADVAIDGDRIVVGNPADPAPHGSIVIYDRGAAGWSWTRIVAPPGAEEFGHSVDIDGHRIVVGAYHSSTAYLYQLMNDEWIGSELHRPASSDEEDFGWDVAIDFEVAAVSAPNGYPGPSSIYTFDAPTGDHLQTLSGFEQDAQVDYFLGHSIDIDRSTLAYTGQYGPPDSYHSPVYLHRINYGRFLDDRGTFEADIEWMAAESITKGCNPPLNDWYCPDSVVTRGQMAAFLTRALDLTDRLDNPFTDDDGHIFEADIERLAAAGITKGCNPPANDQFCPDHKVTREQMAAFLVRAMGYTNDGGGDLFSDDDLSIFEGDIDRLATAGVTKGCNPPENDMFCPTKYVTRDQMAAFLHRALG